MAAPRKITPEMETEIVRRRAAGEPIKAIAADFGIAHQTVSKLAKRAAARALEAPPRATEGREQHAHILSAPRRVARARPTGVPSFATSEERYAYYERRSLESYVDWLNFRDVVRGRETPAELRARRARESR